jgi:hypothetical protein
MRERGSQMNATKTNNGNSQDYLMSIRLMVCPNGSAVAIIGNQRLTLSSQEVIALVESLLNFGTSTALLNERAEVLV